MKSYRHFFFDMDKTIAPSRQPILPEMYELLSSLEADIIIASGQNNEKIAWQSNNLRAIKLGQNGNVAEDYDGTELWKEVLRDEEKQEVMTHIAALEEAFSLSPKPEWQPIEDRGAQITYSPIGNQAPVEEKLQYDPDATKRLAMLEQVPFVSDTLTVKIGGSTSFDYFKEDSNKGTNVAKLIALKGWNKDECVYYGDGLYPGGNDEAVIGVIETIPVIDHIHTYKLFSSIDK